MEGDDGGMCAIVILILDSTADLAKMQRLLIRVMLSYQSATGLQDSADC